MPREETLAHFKERMRAGNVLVGMQHSSGSEAIIELLGCCGFDFVVIDMEHSGYSITVVESMVRAADAVGIVAFVRVLKNDPHLIGQALDTGAQGIVVPHLRTRRDCEAAAAAMRYLPHGIRGKTSGSRAARWGTSDALAYQDWANTETMLIPLIEDREAVDVIEEILAVPGIELMCLGPGDLAQSYNVPGQGLRAAPVMAALERAIRFCAPRNIAVMTLPIPDMTNEWAHELVAKGARIVWYSVDMTTMGRHFKQLAAVKG